MDSDHGKQSVEENNINNHINPISKTRMSRKLLENNMKFIQAIHLELKVFTSFSGCSTQRVIGTQLYSLTLKSTCTCHSVLDAKWMLKY